MANKIKLKRGLSSNISSVVLDDGEVALTTDTNRLYSKKGEIAPNNVYVGTSEPLDSNIECWIDPSEDFNSTTYFDKIYPVGSLYMSISSVDPSNLFGGTWVKIEGKFLLSSSDSYATGTTGGEATHTLTIDEMPSHNHSGSTNWAGDHNHTSKDYYDVVHGAGDQRRVVAYDSATNLAQTLSINNAGNHQHTFTTDYNGGGQTHNNMPPYLVVNMWYRIK